MMVGDGADGKKKTASLYMAAEEWDVEELPRSISIDDICTVIGSTVFDKYGCWGLFLFYLL